MSLFRRALAAIFLSVAAGSSAHAFTFIEPGTFTIRTAAVGSPASHRLRIKELPADSNLGFTFSTSAPDSALPFYNAAADDAPSRRALVGAILVFAGVVSALNRRRAPAPIRVSPGKKLLIVEPQRLNVLENLPLAGTVMQPRVI